MPIYEYGCTKCGAQFEEWQKISDAPLETCKLCGGKAKRLISQTTFILKGTGWYVTDYGRGNNPASAKPSNTSEKKESSGDSTSAKKDAGSSGTSGTDSSASSNSA